MTFTTRKIREEKVSVTQKLAKSAPVFLRVGAVFATLFSFVHKRRKEEQKQEKRTRILKRIVIILVAALTVVVILAGTIKALVHLRILTPGTIYSVAGTDLPVDDDGFTNILLLGTGDKNHDGVDLTDTLMIASLDPKTKSTMLFSIPRDLYVTESMNMGTGRINELYRNYKSYLRRTEKLTNDEASKEALEELAREMGRKTGLPIHRIVKVDFTAFVDVVDALGGVDIEVTKDIVDTEYPGPNYSYQTFSIEAGPQHIDGETALKYARSRHSTSDFDRSLRQQQIIQALGRKAHELGIFSSPGKIMSLLKIFSEHVQTTMTVSEMIGAGKLAQSIDRDKLLSMQLNDRSGLYEPGGFIGSAPRDQFGGAAVLLPIAPGNTPGGSWGEIRTFVNLLAHNRTTYLTLPSIVILNAGAPTGLARMLANELGRYGFMVKDTGNATADGKAPKDADKREDTIVTVTLPEDKASAQFFSTLLGLPMGELPPLLPPETLGQVTIILGKDYVFKPLAQLIPQPVIPAELLFSSSSSSSLAASSASSL